MLSIASFRCLSPLDTLNTTFTFGYTNNISLFGYGALRRIIIGRYYKISPCQAEEPMEMSFHILITTIRNGYINLKYYIACFIYIVLYSTQCAYRTLGEIPLVSSTTCPSFFNKKDTRAHRSTTTKHVSKKRYHPLGSFHPGTTLMIILMASIGLLAIMPTSHVVPSERAALFLEHGDGVDFNLGTLDDTTCIDDDPNPKLVLTRGKWERELPSSKPLPRFAHTMAALPGTDKMVLFGGMYHLENGSPVYLNDTWMYDLSDDEWVYTTPAQSPPKGNYSMCCVDNDGTIVIFNLDDLCNIWVYDVYYNTWSDQILAIGPTGSQDNIMAPLYDTDKVILFGGVGGNETWIYDHGDLTWTDTNAMNPPIISSNRGMASLTGNDAVALFDGLNGHIHLYDLDENNWTQRASENSMTHVSNFKISSLHTDDKIVLFGGGSGKTFVYDLSDDLWTEKISPESPSIRSGFSLTPVHHTGKVVLFGGNLSGIYFNDTWTFDASAYLSSGTYESVPYDTIMDMRFDTLSWSADTPPGTHIKFQLKTAQERDDLQNMEFIGPDKTISSYYQTNGQSLWSGHRGDSWYQYRAYLGTTDNTNTPSLSDVMISCDGIPVISDITTHGTEQTGDVPIEFVLSDWESTACGIVPQYSIDGVTFFKATEGDASVRLDDLSSSPAGTTHTFVWDSQVDLSGQDESSVYIRIIPEDCDQGYNATTAAFHLDNNGIPSVEISPLGTVSGDVHINYSLSDPESDPCNILVEFSLDDGGTFKTATQGPDSDGLIGLTTSEEGQRHRFVWASMTDIGPIERADVLIRITPADMDAGASDISSHFAVDNENARPGGPLSDDIEGEDPLDDHTSDNDETLDAKEDKDSILSDLFLYLLFGALLILLIMLTKVSPEMKGIQRSVTNYLKKEGATSKKPTLATKRKKGAVNSGMVQGDGERRCCICLGKIKLSLDDFHCTCGNIFHPSCAIRVGECPKCQNKITKEDVGSSEEEFDFYITEDGVTTTEEKSDPKILATCEDFNISDIYLIYLDGTLIKSVSLESSLGEDMDEDIMGGMLTTVTQFVKDTFSKESGNLKTLQYGKMTIFLERGVTVFLAVVFHGEPIEDLRKRMRTCLIKVWQKYRKHLKAWDGGMDDLEGIEGDITEFLGIEGTKKEVCGPSVTPKPDKVIELEDEVDLPILTPDPDVAPS